ncbi:uncharacterized protein G2W53_033003 [Senna tora]|uniref:Uncharacterized protein n=1 Tax=Senna tora TaxID=362788 RepID=A0A834T1F7_9FABA|nr:uncharacterized protein G2W53_033003 [Senna tora]
MEVCREGMFISDGSVYGRRRTRENMDVYQGQYGLFSPILHICGHFPCFSYGIECMAILEDSKNWILGWNSIPGTAIQTKRRKRREACNSSQESNSALNQT